MNTRMKAITEAATLLFLRQGYARTQISHIAKAIDVSVGTIYHDFAEKKKIRQIEQFIESGAIYYEKTYHLEHGSYLVFISFCWLL